MKRVNWWRVAAGTLIPLPVVFLFVVWSLASIEHDANALANPIKQGRNVVVNATPTPRQVSAAGQRCNVVLSNVDQLTKKFPVYTCFRNQLGDGGIGCSSTIGQPICDNSLTTTDGCLGNYISRDYTSDTIYIVTKASFSPDGGVPVRVEQGTGCDLP